MKNYWTLITLLFHIIICNAQVGINTLDPKAVLDVDGDMKLRTVNQMTSIGDPTILVRDEASDHLIKGIKYSKLFGINESLVYAYQKSSEELIKLSLNTTTTIGTIQWNLFSLTGNAQGEGGYLPIGNSSVFDGTTYTAPSNGYYLVNLELQFTGTLNAGLLGARSIAVIKNNNSIVYSKPYDGVTVVIPLGVTLLNVPLSSSTMETIVYLNQGETLKFGIQNSTLNADLLGGSTFKLQVFKLPN